MTYTQVLRDSQHLVDAETISTVDSIAPHCGDDVTIASARFWDRPAPAFAADENVLRTATLLAWEAGAVSGLEALDRLDSHGLLDYDYVASLMLDDMRARAGEVR